jgi:hypothetical protein
MGGADDRFPHTTNIEVSRPQSPARVRASCNQCDRMKRSRAEAAPNVSSRIRINVEIVIRPPYVVPAR